MGDSVEPRNARGGTLILGGGFGGSWIARLLGKSGATIVNPDNFSLFTPLLPEAASGTVEPRHVVVPLRQMCPHADLLLGSVEALDSSGRVATVNTEAGQVDVSYERVVVALGAVSRTLPIPGLAEHGVGFKTLADAIYLRNHVLRRLEAADAATSRVEAQRQLTFVFVGAGYAGVEALAESRDLVLDAIRHYPNLKTMPQRWVLVDAAPAILAEIPRRLGAYAARHLEKQGIEIHCSTRLESVERDGVTLSTEERIGTETLVWTAGVKPNPLVAELGLPLDERGRIVVDDTLAVDGHPGVWALGDCAAVANSATPEELDPPTCQHALRQARSVARNIERLADGHEPKSYGYRMLGQVATLGRHKGIADALGLKFGGFLGWWIARTYHLYQLPLFSRKLRLVADWTTALFFRRDIAELSVLTPRPPKLPPD
ncbi:MAG: NAD(P)/FAD-dependent oxidoreductase [Gaiellaceae bacterium]